jgi:hypothetical protein
MITPVAIFKTHSTLPNRIQFTGREILDLQGEQMLKTKVRMPLWSAEDGLTVQLNNQMLAKNTSMEKNKKMMAQLLMVKTIKF